MSFGHTGALRFDVNKNTPGIFWEREKPKADKRKFGYKSKNLRHAIRQPDNEELEEELVRAQEEEKRKYNRDNVDFINKNRHRYKPKPQDKTQSNGSTHIGPGTVTLTQDQLAALLATLGGLNNADASKNKIEVEKYDSDSDIGDDVKINGYDNDDNQTGDSVGMGIYDLLDNGDIVKKSSKSKKKQRDTNLRLSGEKDKKVNYEDAHQVPETFQNGSGGDTNRSTLDAAKKEARVDHISPAVPWKHMTVGEKKRMQWAMEKAELQADYDPWGRPGAGAPMGKQESPKPPEQSNTSQNKNRNVRVDNKTAAEEKLLRKRQQEELQNEIEQLQREIREAEQKKRTDVNGQHDDEEVEERSRAKAKNRKGNRERRAKEDMDVDAENARNKTRVKKDNSESKRAAVEKEENNEHIASEEENLSHLTKKELERRKWLAELDKQREEQRMKKQHEKELDRASMQDQWADRFVYHKSPQHATPRYEQPTPRNQVSVLGKAVEDAQVTHAPPVAMRSSIVVGAGTLNEARFDNKKADEKRAWLEELEKQREEHRRVKQELKDRERREDDGMWADRYQTDRQKLTQFGGGTSSSGQGPPVVTDHPKARDSYEMPAERVDAQRGYSAPEQPLTVRDSQEEPTTFIRGQGVYVDPTTRHEQEEKRRVHMEYQAEIKAQIEEKERLKRGERQRKAREDIEEEKKLQMERDRTTRQEETDQKKSKEREALRQKQMAVLKSAMDEAQEKAQEEKNVKRMQHLQEHGHDVSHLKATYEGRTPRVRDYDISAIPGLGSQNGPSPSPPQQQAPPHHPSHHASDQMENQQPRGGMRPMGQSYTKDPYMEDRVLTPSRFRDPSRPRDEPNSPRREFGTQTLELKDLQAILHSLPDDIQIEYKMRVEEALKEKAKQAPLSRKVHSKSAEDSQQRRNRKTAPPRKEAVKDKPAGREKPPKGGERLAWNQTKRKTAIKNSERDPFYEQRKEEAEARKLKRERQLQYLQELNKGRIPSLSPTRGRAATSPDERRRNPPERAGRKVAAEANGKARKGAPRDESPNVLSLIADDRTRRAARSKSPTRRNNNRSSPPLPSVKHRTAVAQEDGGDPNNPYSYTNAVLRTSHGDTHYGDASVATAPIHDGEFVPFMRTTEILDPAQAGEPLAISRENSRMTRARKAYHDIHHPANKGRKLNVYQDREREAALKAAQDPILNPQLVTDHPTARQDMILKQLSSLKQNLMQRRQELENYMSPSELEAEVGSSMKA